MTITFGELGLYALGLLVLFLTPGPVWVALMARAVSGGFPAAFPLALGVVIGDVLWPFLAILGVSWLVQEIDGFMMILRWAAVVIFVWVGVKLIRSADRQLGQNSKLTAPGAWAGFAAGLAVILGNPKAILFYMGVLPGFFDLTKLNSWDIAAICALSALIPLLGNVGIALLVHRARAIVRSPDSIRKLNTTSGVLLILVGIVIGLT